jgi:hypothetical protein
MKAKNKKVKNNDIEFGTVDLTAEESAGLIDPMIRTTIFLNASLIRAYKAEAAKRKMKYQQLMREKLRESQLEDSGLESRVRRLELLLQKKRA